MERSLSLARGKGTRDASFVVDEPIRGATINFYAAPLEKAVNVQIPDEGKWECGLFQLFCGVGPVLSLFGQFRMMCHEKCDRKGSLCR